MIHIYPLKTSENLLFFHVFNGVEKWNMAKMCYLISVFNQSVLDVCLLTNLKYHLFMRAAKLLLPRVEENIREDSEKISNF